MRQVLSMAEGVCAGLGGGAIFCGTSHKFLNTSSTTSGLAAELKRRATNPNARLIGAYDEGYLDEANSPVLTKIAGVPGNGLRRGQTYVIWARPGNGKSATLQDFIANHLRDDQDGLYINVETSANILEALQKALNTTCDIQDIVDAFVSALSTKGKIPRKRKPFLVIDEVNHFPKWNADGGEATASFIQYLFQKIARDGTITCMIASNKKETATALVNLNGGKIIPHPNFMQGVYTYNQNIVWQDFDWDIPQLEALLKLKFPTATLGYDFLRQGMTPGYAHSAYETMLDAAMLP